jgi:hypothetical protein
MYAYDVWNEPHLEPSGGREFNASTDQKLYCYCEKTVSSFQNWLEQRYGTLEKPSEAWVRRYPSWDVIDPPRGPGAYIDWVDWRRFRVKTLRAVDTRSILESHVFSQAVIIPLASGRTDGNLGAFVFPSLAGVTDLLRRCANRTDARGRRREAILDHRTAGRTRKQWHSSQPADAASRHPAVELDAGCDGRIRHPLLVLLHRGNGDGVDGHMVPISTSA